MLLKTIGNTRAHRQKARMLGVSGTPVSDAVGKLGDLGDRLSDKTYALLTLTHGLMIRLAEPSVGCVCYTYRTLRYDVMGIIPQRGFPCD